MSRISRNRIVLPAHAHRKDARAQTRAQTLRGRVRAHTQTHSYIRADHARTHTHSRTHTHTHTTNTHAHTQHTHAHTSQTHTHNTHAHTHTRHARGAPRRRRRWTWRGSARTSSTRSCRPGQNILVKILVKATGQSDWSKQLVKSGQRVSPHIFHALMPPCRPQRTGQNSGQNSGQKYWSKHGRRGAVNCRSKWSKRAPGGRQGAP